MGCMNHALFIQQILRDCCPFRRYALYRAPWWGPGAEPLIRESGAKPHEAKRLFRDRTSKMKAQKGKITSFQFSSVFQEIKLYMIFSFLRTCGR